MQKPKLLPERGAGGTDGGIGRFFVGLLMLLVGGYLLLRSIRVTSSFGLSYGLYSVSGFQVTSGYVLIPFMFGVGMVFYNARNFLGWILALGSLASLVFGVITSIHFRLEHMNAFQLISILVLLVGGLGILASSVRSIQA